MDPLEGVDHALQFRRSKTRNGANQKLVGLAPLAEVYVDCVVDEVGLACSVALITVVYRGKPVADVSDVDSGCGLFRCDLFTQGSRGGPDVVQFFFESVDLPCHPRLACDYLR